MERLGSNRKPDNVIENWRTKAWEIVEKADKDQLTEEEFSRLFEEFIELRPDLRDQEHFSSLIEEMPKWLESDRFTFSKFRKLIIEILEEVLKEA